MELIQLYSMLTTVKPIVAIMGAYPVMTSSEEFARMKQEEIELDERKLRR